MSVILTNEDFLRLRQSMLNADSFKCGDKVFIRLDKALDSIADTFETMAMLHGSTWNYQVVGECELMLKEMLMTLVEER